MDSSPVCPVCGSKKWTVLGTRTYSKPYAPSLPEYVKIRLDVLFNLWTTDRTESTFSSVICDHCGFVAFTPRPTEEDVNRKYSYLHTLAAVQEESRRELKGDKRRSMDLFQKTKNYLDNASCEVLDFGGGNGRLLSEFIKAGHRCSIVDYVSATLPGIEHIGNTLDKVPEGRRFDLIICSHVLEHLAQPRTLLESLLKHLRPEGFLYAEVPMEMWNCIPLPIEPVTHINFFSASSFRALLEYAGLDVVECQEGTYNYDGSLAMAVKAIARPGAGKRDVVVAGNPESVLQLIHPTRAQALVRSLKFPNHSLQALKYWARRRIPLLWRFTS